MPRVQSQDSADLPCASGRGGRARASGWGAGVWLLFCLVLGTWSEFAPVAARQLPEANATRLGGDERRTRFVADLSRKVDFKAYVIPEPYRVVIDLEEVNFHLPVGLGGKGLGLIRAYRYGLIDEGRSRIVMDTRGPVLIERAFLVDAELGQPARIVVDVVPTDKSTFAALYRRQSLRQDSLEDTEQERDPVAYAVEAPLPSPPASGEPESEPGPPASAPPGENSVAAADPPSSAPPVAERPAKVPAPRDRHPHSPKRKKPGIRTIVIDPGHGGIDPGAIGRSGTKEKDIVLAFAHELASQIERRSGYEAVLTRTSDTFVSLRDRVRIARHNAADLFIVVHADIVRNKRVRGATVYTLSETGSDPEAEELARNENRSDLIAGVDLAEESDEIAGILIDLAQREAKNHASFFARSVVDELKRTTRFTGKPLRAAGFQVLRAPDVPSILLELGYLSHDADEAQLRSAAWRSKIALRLARAVDTYFRTTLASGPRARALRPAGAIIGHYPAAFTGAGNFPRLTVHAATAGMAVWRRIYRLLRPGRGRCLHPVADAAGSSRLQAARPV